MTTFCEWKARFGGLDVSQAKRLKALEGENLRLERMLADAMLDNAVPKDLPGKSGGVRRASGGWGICSQPGGSASGRRAG